MTATAPDPSVEAVAAQAEVIDILRDLIRIDTTNDGTDTGPGEAAAAEYVEASLTEAGLEVERFSTTSSRRQGVVARIPAHLLPHLGLAEDVPVWPQAEAERRAQDKALSAKVKRHVKDKYGRR